MAVSWLSGAIISTTSDLNQPVIVNVLILNSSDQLHSSSDQFGDDSGAVLTGQTGQRVTGLDKAWATGAG